MKYRDTRYGGLKWRILGTVGGYREQLPRSAGALLLGEEAKMLGTHGIAIWDSVVAGQVVH